MGGACRTRGEVGNAYKILVENPEGKMPLRRPRCRWEGKIKMSLTYCGKAFAGLIWIRVGTGGGLL
jgi:hypothetical protein